MIEYPFRLENEFIDELFEAIKLSKKPPETETELPSKEQLKRLVEVSTIASVAKEEARSIVFAISYGNIKNDPFSYVFAAPLFFDNHNLVRLAPALINTRYLINVKSNEKGDLCIWGFTSLSPYLTISAIEPMKIIVSCHQIDGVVTSSKAFLVSDKFAFFGLLADKSKDKCEYLKNIDRFWATHVGDLGMSLRKIAHGGTILIVVNNDQWKESAKEQIRFATATPYSMLRKAIQGFHQDRLKVKEEKNPDTKAVLDILLFTKWKDLVRPFRDIGNLTAVDGAMVLTYDFDVLAFGVKIKAKTAKESPDSILWVEPVNKGHSSSKNFADIGGTRHQSAAQFVFDQKDCIALVASQDGKLTIFYWDYEIQQVVAFTNLELIFTKHTLIT